MSLRTAIQNDATLVFTVTDDFAEIITYYPHKYYGAVARDPRAINAVVFREAITQLSEDGDVVTYRFEVHVANDSVLGIASDELDTGGDQLEFPARDGKAAERRTITALSSQDHGMLILECR